MECQDLTIYRKSTKAYELQFKKNGVGVDITDWTVYMTIKQSMEDPDESAKLAKKVTSHNNPTTGKTIIELSSTDTDIPAGNYWYAIDYLDDDGNEDTLVWGKIKIKEPVLKTRN